MQTIFGIAFFISILFAVGSIEDCGGACAGNDNWLMFGVFTITGLICGFMTIYLQSKENR